NIGQVLLKTNNYGAVVQHIEPEHLEQVSIPNPPSLLKRNIHTRVMDSFKLRDESNALIDEAQRELAEELKLPALEKLAPKRFTTFGLHAFSAKLSNLHGRFEGTFHTPLINNITQHLREHCDEVTTVGDERISKRILLPGRFKRIYVEEGQGVVFFGGKQLLELDPTGEKFLSLSLHSNRIHGDLRLSENMVLVSRSGTIGKVNIVPKHWVNWIANEHIIRIIPQSDDLAGYIFAWLDSEFGYELIRRFSYGSVVDELDTNQLSQVQIPLLRDKKAQASINTRVLTANEKRYQAYLLEQEAIAMVENMVILTGKKTTYPSSSISDRLHASVAEGQRNSKPV
ncbi:MAG TPA: restriction endonuclease subunit S, partial [Candidatus Hodarchaeales archaeon]|nr:restriction endonuclease subunit S [Candidatus Hodarchaeales archaeon]